MIEDNLLNGRTGTCDAFGNDPLVEGGVFTVKSLEVIGALQV